MESYISLNEQIEYLRVLEAIGTENLLWYSDHLEAEKKYFLKPPTISLSGYKRRRNSAMWIKDIYGLIKSFLSKGDGCNLWMAHKRYAKDHRPNPMAMTLNASSVYLAWLDRQVPKYPKFIMPVEVRLRQMSAHAKSLRDWMYTEAYQKAYCGCALCEGRRISMGRASRRIRYVARMRLKFTLPRSYSIRSNILRHPRPVIQDLVPATPPPRRMVLPDARFRNNQLDRQVFLRGSRALRRINKRSNVHQQRNHVRKNRRFHQPRKRC
jgi:hypothetical protein